MDIYSQIVSRIIKEQQNIIGPVAIREAVKVTGLKVNNLEDIEVTGDHKEVIKLLVEQYAKLFGTASVEICKEAIEPIIDEVDRSELPDIITS